MRSAVKSTRYAVGATALALALAAATAACSSSPSSSSSTGAASGTGSSASASGGSSTATVTNVTLGYVPYSDDASLFYAQNSGIFRKHGLNVTFVAQASPVAVEASMASGTEQFGFITTPGADQPQLQGRRRQVRVHRGRQRADQPRDDTTVLVAAKGSGITGVKDLAGKNVAEVQLTSLNSLSVMVLAKQAGHRPARPSTRSRSRSRRCRPRSPRAGCRRR